MTVTNKNRHVNVDLKTDIAHICDAIWVCQEMQRDASCAARGGVEKAVDYKQMRDICSPFVLVSHLMF